MIVGLFLSLVWAASWDPVREQHEEYQSYKGIECVENFVSLLLEKHWPILFVMKVDLPKKNYEIKRKHKLVYTVEILETNYCI